MLNSNDLLEKTEKGQEELRTRQYKLPGKMRMLLLLVDGNHSVAELREKVEEIGLTEASLETLVTDGFLALRGGTASQPDNSSTTDQAGASAEAGGTAFSQARRLMNESIFNTLGLKGFFFTLKIEKAGTLDDLRELFPEYQEIMQKSLSSDSADLFIERVRVLLA